MSPLSPSHGRKDRAARRRSPRYSYKAPLEIQWGNEVLKGTLGDISSSGMYIKIDRVLWIGAEFTARVLLFDPVQMTCVVRRVEAERGMGVEFLEVLPDSRRTLDELMWKLASE
jgi:c-di-GMP-binding flagellar brake protein YcgR